MEPIYHITRRTDWESAVQSGGPYSLSTRGKTLEQVGFIHASFRPQVAGTANLIYHGEPDLVLLEIDPNRLTDPLRVEKVAGSNQEFPHLYGPLPLVAVVAVHDLIPQIDGSFVFHQ